MNLTWRIDQSSIDWDELSQLYLIAPLGIKPAEDLKVIFTNSKFKCFLYNESYIIGIGRALADGSDCSYICDIAIHPEYQGFGFGKQIVQNLIKQSEGHKKIILYANLGKEGFYSKCGRTIAI